MAKFDPAAEVYEEMHGAAFAVIGIYDFGEYQRACSLLRMADRKFAACWPGPLGTGGQIAVGANGYGVLEDNGALP